MWGSSGRAKLTVMPKRSTQNVRHQLSLQTDIVSVWLVQEEAQLRRQIAHRQHHPQQAVNPPILSRPSAS
jgi:hypothetical protein